MAEGNVYWTVRRGSTATWCVNASAMGCLWGNKTDRLRYDRRHLALQAACWAARDNAGVVLVKVTRRPKPKPVSREVWEGSVVGEILRMGHAVNGSTGRDRHSFGTWLTRNDGKRVRVTLEVLP